jgi:hypothetical protein
MKPMPNPRERLSGLLMVTALVISATRPDRPRHPPAWPPRPPVTRADDPFPDDRRPEL